MPPSYPRGSPVPRGPQERLSGSIIPVQGFQPVRNCHGKAICSGTLRRSPTPPNQPTEGTSSGGSHCRPGHNQRLQAFFYECPLGISRCRNQQDHISKKESPGVRCRPTPRTVTIPWYHLSVSQARAIANQEGIYRSSYGPPTLLGDSLTADDSPPLSSASTNTATRLPPPF